MRDQRHTIGDLPSPIAERSTVAGAGGARSPQRAAPANRRDQTFPGRRPLPFRNPLAAHSGGGFLLERIHARQPLRHARGALRRTRPTAIAKSRPIVLNRGKSRFASSRAMRGAPAIGRFPAACHIIYGALLSLGHACGIRVVVGLNLKIRAY